MCEVRYYGNCRPVIAQVATADGKQRLLDIRDIYILFPEQNALIKMNVQTTDLQDATYSSSAGLCGEETVRLQPTASSYKRALVAAATAIAQAPAPATGAAVATTSGTAAGVTTVPLPTPDELVGDEAARYSVCYYASQQQVPHRYYGSFYGQCVSVPGEADSEMSAAAFGWPGRPTRPSGSMCY